MTYLPIWLCSFSCWSRQENNANWISRGAMLTIDEVAAIPLFSALPAAQLERLARTSADLHLGTGEFAVHEGGEGALFAVVAGKIEVVKTFDGVERTLGWRVPGAIFGEVPIALGTAFPGGYRAAEPSRERRWHNRRSRTFLNRRTGLAGPAPFAIGIRRRGAIVAGRKRTRCRIVHEGRYE